MLESLSLSCLRGTMFYPRVAFDWSIANKFIENIEGVFPVNYGSPCVDGNVVYNPGDWELRSQDGSIRLIFSAQKIDYVEYGQKNSRNDAIQQFTNKCCKIFEGIVKVFGHPSSRLAIAPTFTSTKPLSETKDILSRIYLEDKMSFDGSCLDNCEFSQVFRPIKSISGAKISVNFLSKFSTEQSLISVEGVSRQIPIIKVDFDINTTPNLGVNFPIESIHEFYEKASSFCEDFYQFYFNF